MLVQDREPALHTFQKQLTPMARQVIIHAGQHRTGSTSIQQYLKFNRDQLSRRGIAVCPNWTAGLERIDAGNLNCNAKAIANAVIRDSLQTPVRLSDVCPILNPAQKIEGLARVNAYLRQLPQETVILSAEALSFVRQSDELELIEKLCLGMDFRALMFLRNPNDWLESWKSQVAYLMAQNLAEASSGTGVFDFSESTWLTDHDAMRGAWGNRCKFLSYEAALKTHGSVIPAFLIELGLDPASCHDWKCFVANSSATKKLRLAGNQLGSKRL